MVVDRPPTPIDRSEITGLLLAGGQARRMGGIDKGLQHWAGAPLAEHALRRLIPQVSEVLISANRHQSWYAACLQQCLKDQQSGSRSAFPVVATAPGGNRHEAVFADAPNLPSDGQNFGPLAGIWMGVQRCATQYLLCVPCDMPLLPLDLAAKLGHALAGGDHDLAIAQTDDGQHPVVCLMRLGQGSRVASQLQAMLERGDPRVQSWVASLAHVVVHFEQTRAFLNINRLQDLHAPLSHPC